MTELTVQEQAAAIVDGIYFRLPAEVYHAVPRLSASGVQKLLVSPATFWSGSWLDPDRPAADEEATKAQVIGKAYHTARLEPHLFLSSYVRELDKSEQPKGTLFTGTEMGVELASMGLTKTGSVAEQADRLAAGGCTKPLWHLMLREWEAARGERIALPATVWDEIERDMQRIHSSPEISALLSAGFAEVSVFWTDEKGMACKCRIDHLQPEAWQDFKTFANPQGKHLEQAITDAFRYNRYHVQAAFYRDAIEVIRAAGLEIIGDAEAEERELIEAMQLTDELACWYVFQEKGGVPNLLARRVRFHDVPISTVMNNAITDDPAIHRRAELATRTPSLWWERAQREIRKAKRLFRTYSEVYTPGEPWLPFNPLGEISDLSFSAFWLDEEVGE